MGRPNEWSRDQLLLALRLYLRTSFGRLHAKNPEIVKMADCIGRTPNALAMKAVNFASIDPKLNRKGLSNASKADLAIWQEFESNPTRLALEAEIVADRFTDFDKVEHDSWIAPVGPTEIEAAVNVRRVQSFFRAAVLASYESRCAITGLAIPELLVASHIVPWSESETLRADPRNGICLNALFDKIFDRGFMTLDQQLKIVYCQTFKEQVVIAEEHRRILMFEGQRITAPNRFAPHSDALAHHRERVFRQ